MDTVKTGKFISGLRRNAGLTQEQLGERLGVTNKTVYVGRQVLHIIKDIATNNP